MKTPLEDLVNDTDVQSRIENLRMELLGVQTRPRANDAGLRDIQKIVDSGSFDPRPFTIGENALKANSQSKKNSSVFHLKPAETKKRNVAKGAGNEDWESEADKLVDWSKTLPTNPNLY